MTLASLPVISVGVAFSPTNIQAAPSSQTFTDVTQYVRDFTTKMGTQHMLDRIEAGTIQFTLDNRSGYFSQTGTVLNTRLPVIVTATWSGTTYPIFYGLTEAVTERITDALNVDLDVTATDLMKMLSLRYLQVPNFWATYANVSSTAAWYRLGITKVATVTGASNPGTGTVTYQAVNNFNVGDIVTVTGLSIPTGTSYPSLNVVNGTVSVVGPKNSAGYAQYFEIGGFTSVTAYSAGSGTAVLNDLYDSKNNVNYTSNLTGSIAFPNYGALIYDMNTCIDLTDGTNTASGAVTIPMGSLSYGSASTNGLDFWVLGQGMQGSQIVSIGASVGGNAITFFLTVNSEGQLNAGYTPYGGSFTPVVPSNPHTVADGFWHHVGLVLVGTTMYYYVDGDFQVLYFGVDAASVFDGGNIGNGLAGEYELAAYIDEAVALNSSANQTDVLNRYKAGSLLQIGGLSTADMIAEVLCLAGFGYVASGAVVVPNYYVSPQLGTVNAWSPGTASTAYTEPYYWDTPVTSSTALDLIMQIADTEVGRFYQRPDGSWRFNTQTYYGTWTWTGTSGSWSTTYATPTGNYVWADDNSGVPYYGPSTQVIRDDADLWTSVRVDPQAGASQVYENTSAEPQYGNSTLTKSATINSSLNAALSEATYLGYLYRSPLPRVGAVEMRSETSNGYYNAVLLGTNFGDVVQFKRNPPGSNSGGQVNLPMIVESIAHDFAAEPGYLHTTFVLDPYPVRS